MSAIENQNRRWFGSTNCTRIDIIHVQSGARCGNEGIRYTKYITILYYESGEFI